MKLFVTETYSNGIRGDDLNDAEIYGDLLKNSDKDSQQKSQVFSQPISQLDSTFQVEDNRVAGTLKSGLKFVGNYNVESQVLTLSLLKQISQSDFEVVSTEILKADTKVNFFYNETEVEVSSTFLLKAD